MKNLKKLGTVAMVSLILLLVAGCSGEYDGLRVVDGDGRLFQLNHRVGVVYAVQPVNKKPLTPNEEINKKLPVNIGN